MNSWKEISLEDKFLFDSYFKGKEYLLSDFTFTNLYLWRFARKTEYMVENGFLCIRITYPERTPYFLFPLGKESPSAVIEKLLNQCQKENYNLEFKSLNIDMRNILDEEFHGVFDIVPTRGNFDYVYAVKDLINLEGKKFHDKKNHLNKFKNSYLYSYETLDKANMPEVIAAQKLWCIVKDCPDNFNLENESKGIIDCIENFEYLDFKCGIIRIDKDIAGFSFGERLSSDTVVIHIEKAVQNPIETYTAVNQIFMEKEWSGYKYVNREEDLGIDGLRKAKLSYNPITFIEKYKAVAKPVV